MAASGPGTAKTSGAMRCLWPALVLVSSLLSACAGRSTAPESTVPAFESHYARGREHFAAGRFGLAVADFQAAVAAAPDSVKTLNALAAAYDRVGRPDLATHYYGRALARAPAAAETLNNIGYSLILQKKFDLAVVYLREAQLLDAQHPVIAANRALAEAALHAGRGQGEFHSQAPPRSNGAPAFNAARSRIGPGAPPLAARADPRFYIAETTVGPAALAPLDRRSADLRHGTMLPGPLTAPIDDTALMPGPDRAPLTAASSGGRTTTSDAWPRRGSDGERP